MVECAERHVVRTEVAAFETGDPAGRTFDRVTCAQAWHWFDPAARSGKAATVLGLDVRLCLFWSVGHHRGDLAHSCRTLSCAYCRVTARHR